MQGRHLSCCLLRCADKVQHPGHHRQPLMMPAAAASLFVAGHPSDRQWQCSRWQRQRSSPSKVSRRTAGFPSRPRLQQLRLPLRPSAARLPVPRHRCHLVAASWPHVDVSARTHVLEFASNSARSERHMRPREQGKRGFGERRHSKRVTLPVQERRRIFAIAGHETAEEAGKWCRQWHRGSDTEQAMFTRESALLLQLGSDGRKGSGGQTDTRSQRVGGTCGKTFDPRWRGHRCGEVTGGRPGGALPAGPSAGHAGG